MHIGLLLRRIRASWRERDLNVVACLLRSYLDRCAAAQNDQVSKRDLLSPRLRAVEILLVLVAMIRTPAQFYGARFFLGAAEAGFFPGIVVYLTHWFRHEDRARAGALFMSAIP